MPTKPLHNQNILDFVLQHTGQLQELILFCELNSISDVTAILDSSKDYDFSTLKKDDLLLRFFNENKVIIATGVTQLKDYSIDGFPIEF